MYLITGATGHIGKVVAKQLLINHKKVRCVSRHEEKMRELYDMGAEAFIGDLTDHKFVVKAFEGITAAFCMIPTFLRAEDLRSYQLTVGQNYLDGVKEYGTANLIILSSIGAHMRSGCGVVDGLAALELLFSDLPDLNVLNLRPGSFMENIYSQIPMIKNSGILGSILRGDLNFPMIASADIAEVVVKHFLEMDFRGNKVEYVLGPRDLNFFEITRILSRAMDMQDLQYVRFSKENALQEMINSGIFSQSAAQDFIQMEEAFNSGQGLSDYIRTPENTTPTTFEEFARNIVYAYQHSTAL